MNKTFAEIKTGDYFYITEDGKTYDFKKISDTEAVMNEIVTEFSLEYVVGYYPASIEGEEFPVYYDAQGHEHAEF